MEIRKTILKMKIALKLQLFSFSIDLFNRATYQYTRRFFPFAMPHVMVSNSSCRLCLVMRRPQAIAELHRHGQMSMHCAVDANHLHRRLESKLHWLKAIQRRRAFRSLFKRKKKSQYQFQCLTNELR